MTGVQTCALPIWPGQTAGLIEAVLPENADNKDVTWSSSAPGVATVDNNGNVTAEGGGTATISVTTDQGSFEAECDVEVHDILYEDDDMRIFRNKKTHKKIKLQEAETERIKQLEKDKNFQEMMKI